MKKFLTVALMSGMILGSFAAFAAEDAIIVKKGGEEIKSRSVSITKDGYVYKAGKIDKKIQKDKVAWAWVPKPRDIVKADKAFKAGNFAEAEKAYSSAASEYKLLSWEPYCRLGQIKSLLAQDKKDEARVVMEKVSSYVANRKTAGDIAQINSLLSKYYLEEREFTKALTLIEPLTCFDEEDIAAQALCDKADILKEQYGSKATNDQLQTVAMYYFESALVFPKSKSAPAALLKSYNILKSLHDARAERFAAKLRKDYPNSPEAAQIK